MTVGWVLIYSFQFLSQKNSISNSTSQLHLSLSLSLQFLPFYFFEPQSLTLSFSLPLSIAVFIFNLRWIVFLSRQVNFSQFLYCFFGVSSPSLNLGFWFFAPSMLLKHEIFDSPSLFYHFYCFLWLDSLFCCTCGCIFAHFFLLGFLHFPSFVRVFH